MPKNNRPNKLCHNKTTVWFPDDLYTRLWQYICDKETTMAATLRKALDLLLRKNGY